MGLTDETAADRFVHAIASDWHKAELSSADAALCAYATKLTNAPTQMNEADIIALREQRFDDRAIHDATQVISYFNYINRVADALNVPTEEFVREWEKPSVIANP
ncbi:MAG: peroxidase [Candidatus Promineifilaceae bacterium]